VQLKLNDIYIYTQLIWNWKLKASEIVPLYKYTQLSCKKDKTRQSLNSPRLVCFQSAYYKVSKHSVIVRLIIFSQQFSASGSRTHPVELRHPPWPNANRELSCKHDCFHPDPKLFHVCTRHTEASGGIVGRGTASQEGRDCGFVSRSLILPTISSPDLLPAPDRN
jgi:hypothetical protein